MKRIIAGSSLLFSILLATPQAYAQESVDVIIRENGTERREVIDLPKSMTYPVDSLLSDWKAKNYIDLGKDCSISTVNPQFSDSVYIDRLSRMPTIRCPTTRLYANSSTCIPDASATRWLSC